ncbi:ABC transporter substrate-binding protein [Rhodopseudomonas palustris]|uniref:Periplasmic binding protein n=1 Tax=Rhodopseudomonas palustris (strain BisB18) TaxID=316056 RepID=Q21D70_RHOPB
MLAALALLGAIGTAVAQPLPRIASTNVCTDQLLITLADPNQIIGLSPYSRDPAQSYAAAEAQRYRLLSGGAEDILMLKPDAVVSGQYDKRATRELLRQQGVRVVEFDVLPQSLGAIKQQIRAMAELVGHPDRAAAAIARLDAAIGRARAAAQRPIRVLPLWRRGWVSGAGSLISLLFAETGLINAAADLGIASGGFASLEAIIAARPDILLVSDGGDFAEDEGTALLLHPALEQFYPPSKRIVLPERLTVCGGVMLADALDLLVAELARIER